MSRQKTVNIRLSDIEHQALKRYAESMGVPMSEILRDYVKSLIGDLRGSTPRRSPAINTQAPLARERGDSAQSG